ncbi:MAG: NfeD family protein [Treponema sp.]|nr:NfeD family protein [Treponema sp.]
MLTVFGYISMQWIWLALVVVFALFELGSYNLTTIWLAIAALVMVFLSLLLESLSLPAQALIFIAISAILLVFTRPLAIKKFKMGKTKTNVDDLVGKFVLLDRAIGEFEKGEAKIGGQIWSVVSDDGLEVARGSRCEILRVEGVKLVVRPAESAGVENA